MSDIITVEKDTTDALVLPIMSLREVVMFPKSIVPLIVGRDTSIKAIETALEKHEKRIFLVAQRDPTQEHPENTDLFEVGTISRILQMLRLPDGTIKVLFEGLQRALWNPNHDVLHVNGIPMVQVSLMPDFAGRTAERGCRVSRRGSGSTGRWCRPIIAPRC